MSLFSHRLFSRKDNPLVRVGIVGLGRISDVHIKAFTQHTHVCIESLADVRADIVARRANELSVHKFSTDYKRILSDPAVDVVDILLPHYLHARVAREALKAGKYVICEKPLAIRPHDVDGITEESKKAKKAVYLKQYFRFSALHQALKKAILQDEIGRPYLISCVYTTDDRSLYNDPLSWRGNVREAGGGIFTDVGVHIVDFLQDLFGPAKSVSALMDKKFTKLRTKGEDVSIVTLEFSRGIVANIICTAGDTSYGFRWEKHFYGSEGSLHLIDNGKAYMELSLQKNKKSKRIGVEKDWWERTNISALDDIIGRIVRHEAPAITLQDAKNTLEVIQGAYASVIKGKKVIL